MEICRPPIADCAPKPPGELACIANQCVYVEDEPFDPTTFFDVPGIIEAPSSALIASDPVLPKSDLSIQPVPIEPVDREISAMSETVRHGLFLISVRDAGFYCDDVVNAERSGGSPPLWRLTCNDGLAYVATFDQEGAIEVGLASGQTPLEDRPTAPRSDPLGR